MRTSTALADVLPLQALGAYGSRLRALARWVTGSGYLTGAIGTLQQAIKPDERIWRIPLCQHDRDIGAS